MPTDSRVSTPERPDPDPKQHLLELAPRRIARLDARIARHDRAMTRHTTSRFAKSPTRWLAAESCARTGAERIGLVAERNYWQTVLTHLQAPGATVESVLQITETGQHG